MKRFKIGMYGGKFFPFHKGHLYCVETAAKKCEKLYVILFHGSTQELEILKQKPNEKYLQVEDRIKHLKNGCKHLQIADYRRFPYGSTHKLCRQHFHWSRFFIYIRRSLQICARIQAV